MKKKTMRRISLALVLVLIATALFACGRRNEPNQTDPLGNEAETVTQPEQSIPDETEPMPGTEDWLNENLESIHLNLLNGDYEQVLEILLANQEQMANDPDYNALLYIAYMANGNKDAAQTLLSNPNLDKNAFADAILENAEALSENEKIAAILEELMKHMLALGESDPVAFEAAAKIGAVVQNSDPSDPTAYAVRYLAALAAGDEAAAKAIIEEAKANGISAESLKSTAIAYAKETNLTSVTVEEKEKGKTTTTHYNKGGEVVKSEVTVDNNNGTKTQSVKNSDGNVVGVALFDSKHNVPLRRTFYIFDRMIDGKTGEITETYSGAYEVYEYKGGKVASVTAYDVDGSVLYEVKLDSNGKVVSAYDYDSGTKREFTSEMRAVLNIVVKNGDVVSFTKPTLDGGKVVGKTETTYAYDNPVGLVTGDKKYDGETLIDDFVFTYTFDNNAKAEYKTIQRTQYMNSGAVRETDILEYERGQSIVYTVIKAQKVDGTYVEQSKEIIDYKNHTYVTQDYTGATLDFIGSMHAALDETNTHQLYADLYDADGNRYAHYEPTYDENWNLIKEVDTYYDQQGRVIEEYVFGIDRVVDPENPKNITVYHYEADGMTVEYLEYNTDKQPTYEKATVYDAEGRIIMVGETTYEYTADGKKVVFREYNADKQMTYEQTTLYDAEGRIVKITEYDAVNQAIYEKTTLYDAEGRIDKITESMVTKQTAYDKATIYNDDGRIIMIEETTYEGDVCLTYKATYYDYDEAGRRYFEQVEEWDMQNYVCDGYITQDFYDGDKLIVTQYKIYDNDQFDYVLVQQDQYSYNEDGTLKRIDIFAVNNGNGTRVMQINYFYENGVPTGYSVTEWNSDRSYVVTYYNAMDQIYMIEMYDANGNLVERIELDPATGEVIGPTASVPAESEGE